MFTVAGYQIVHEDSAQNGIKKIYARHLSTSKPVVIVFLSADKYPNISLEEIHEHFVPLEKLTSEHVVRVHAVEKVSEPPGPGVAMILEETSGITLAEYILQKKPISIPKFLYIALQLADAVSDLHRIGIIHQGLTGKSIVIDPETDHVLIQSFTFGAGLDQIHAQSSERAGGRPRPEIDHIPYISPEQTGRMNRMVDFRTDFYSLGVIFYELLTGTPPFISENPMELIHAHMARYPAAPYSIRADIGDMVSKIILKLLAKTPEERYQSAYGIKSDLAFCLKQLNETGCIASFEPARHDISEEFRLPEKIYGRDIELAMVADEYERVKEGHLGITMVAGYSGIGKSRLVFEFKKHVVANGGYFTSGKYDQLQQDIPYSGLIQAYQTLIKQILTETSEQIAQWRKKMLSAIGGNAQVLIDVLPDLELIIGKQPPVSHLPPSDAQNRFLLVFEKFIQVLATKNHPLVLFIDDMQWADAAGLSLMEAFFTATKTRYFYFVGAFRDNEISADHPLLKVLSQIRQKVTNLHTIKLKSVNESDVCRLIADTLQEDADEVKLFSAMVYDKTQGNPFFVRQFLQALHTEGVLSYNYESGRWEWDNKKITAERITDNVVDFMAAKVMKLSDNTQQTLKLASCIGNRFPLTMLSVLAEKSAKEVLSDLREPLGLGFIVPEGDAYRNLLKFKPDRRAQENFSGLNNSGQGDWADHIVLDFLHDKVRQAVYCLVPDERKKNLHLKIGRLILSQTAPQDRLIHIFQIVSHLNHGKDLLEDPNEKRKLAELNLSAGKKAKDAAAFIQAIDYLKTGEGLLADDAWNKDYELAFELKKHRMECEYLCYNFETAESLFQLLLNRAESKEDKASLYNQKMIMLAGLAKHEEAVKIGLTGLRLLGVTLPKKVTIIDMLGSMLALKGRLYGRDIGALMELGEVKDPRILLILKMMMNMGLSAYFCQPYLASYLALKIFKLTLKHGNSSVSPFAYVIYGAALCAIFKDYKTGYQFGTLALTANERYGGPDMTAKVLLYFGGAINIWVNHMNQGIAYNRKAIKSALATGDLNYALYHIQSLVIFHVASGAPLDQVADECDRYFEFVEQSKDTGALNYLISIRQWVKALKGKTQDLLSLDDEYFKESLHIQNMEKDGIKLILFRHYLAKLALLYIMGDYQAALKSARQCAKLQIYHLGTIVIPEYYFYHALLLAAVYDASSSLAKRFYRVKLDLFRSKLKHLALQCPENFRDKYLLVEAESSRISGKDQDAMRLYHESITVARENGFTQNHAVASELAARFYISKEFNEIAAQYMEQARKSFRKWGATTKVAALAKAHPNLLLADSRVRSLREGQPIDFDSIMNSLQMISTEIVFDELLKKLMKIVMENAGARKVQFFTIKSTRIYMEAENSVDYEETKVFKSIPADNRMDLFLPVLNYVQRTQAHLVIDDAGRTGDFTNHAYVQKYQPKSILCLPVIHHSQVVALFYLENNIATAVFTPERVEVLKLLSSQAAISLENARLYENVIQNEKQLREVSVKREEEALRYQAQLRSLSSELSLIEEKERRRIATDLHDRIGHALAHASMKLRQLKNNQSGDDLSEKLDEVNALISQTIQDTQTLTFELSPPILYDLGLEAALDWLAEQTQKQHGIPVEFIDDTENKPIEESLRILLFQATRELMFNMVKHSKATEASVSISKEKDNVRIVIKDNGIGFEASRQKKDIKKGGFGLFSIRERLAHQGGRLEIKSEPGMGSAVTIISPMSSSDKM